MNSYRVLVCDPIAPEGMAILESIAEVELRPGLSEQQLAQAVVGADGLVVRSGAEITERVIEAADKLKIIARAGVGVDNIDVPAATRRGVLVVNCPTGNTVATAEHTIALLMAAARNIPQAHASLQAGKWERKRFVGRQVTGKTLGIIGLGKIGSEVARRARGLGMKIVAHDPYIAPQHADSLGAEMLSLEEVLQRADFLTIHTALTNETAGMIGAEQLALMKPQAVLINCARGGIVDEPALVAALTEGHLSAAALDVFEGGSQPDPELLALDNVIVTPHLGASTSEAQANVAVDAAQQVVDALENRPPRWPVNMPTLPPETLAMVRRYSPLIDSLARVQHVLAPQSVARITVRGSGEPSADRLEMLTRYFLVGLLSPVVEEPVNYVNAFAIAQDRGIEVVQSKMGDAGDYRNLLETVTEADGERLVISGTLADDDQVRIVAVAGFETDLVPGGVMLLIWNAEPEQPGFVGRLGTLLGDAEISIQGLQVAQGEVRGEGLMVVQLTEHLAANLLAQIRDLRGVTRTELVEFD